MPGLVPLLMKASARDVNQRGGDATGVTYRVETDAVEAGIDAFVRIKPVKVARGQLPQHAVHLVPGRRTIDA